jgi:hypothetical protein
MTDSAKWFTAKVKDYVQQSIFSVEEIKNRWGIVGNKVKYHVCFIV